MAIETMCTFVRGVNRQPYFLTRGPGVRHVSKEQLHGPRAQSSPLRPRVDRQVEQLRLRRRVSEGSDAYDRTIRNQGERLPVKVPWPDVRLRKDDERDWLVASNVRELFGRDRYGQRRTPVVLVDGREAKVMRVVHAAIVALRVQVAQATRTVGKAGFRPMAVSRRRLPRESGIPTDLARRVRKTRSLRDRP